MRILAIVLVLVSLTFAAGNDPQAVFAEAKTLYKAAQYDSVVALLKTYVKKNGRDASTEYIVPLLLEALERTGDAEYSLKLIDIYIQRFPKSTYVSRVRYSEGMARSHNGDYRGALPAFSQALDASLVPALDTLAMQNVRRICERALTPDELTAIADRADLNDRVREMVEYQAAVRLAQSGQAARAEKRATQFGLDFPHSPLLPGLKDAAKGRVNQKGQVNVGLLAPVSGEYADIGKRIVQGVQLAVDKHNASAVVKVNLVIADTRSSMVETALKTRELMDEMHVPVIIGPVLSPQAVVTAAMVARRDIVMITPTATEDGISQLGNNIFQLNITMGTLGTRMADYAMNNLRIRDFAIIAPSSDYGRLLAQSFRDEVLRNGGEIAAEESFEEGANDFKPLFKDLRRKLAQRRWDRETAADGGMRRSPRADSSFVQDSVLSVGGIFIPAESDDVIMLAPQVFFYKLKGQLLGATGWHNPKVVLDGKQYVNNALVATTMDPDRDDSLFADFRRQYMARTSSEPDRVAALAYDAAELVCGVVKTQGAAVAPKEIARVLQATRGYHGVSGMISFDQNDGANKESAVVKISDRQFLRVQ